jgi:hypothetical protein
MSNSSIVAVVLSITTVALTGCQQEIPPITATVTGSAPVGSTVKATVAGKEYTVKPGPFGSYKITSEVPTGSSEVVLEITDPQGNVSATTRKVVAGVTRPDPRVTLSNGYAISPEEAVMAEIRDLASSTQKSVEAIAPKVEEVRKDISSIKGTLGDIAHIMKAQAQAQADTNVQLHKLANTQTHTTVHPVGVTPAAPVAAPTPKK